MNDQIRKRRARPVILKRDAANWDGSNITIDLSHLHTPTPGRTLFDIGMNWTIISASVIAATHLESAIAAIIAMLLVATRQHALLIIMHDAAHYGIHRNKQLNDIISDYLIAYPLFVSTASYRKLHMDHHRHLNTATDPDYSRRMGQADWTFPKDRRQIALIFVREIMGQGLLYMLRMLGYYLVGKRKSSESDSTAKVRTSSTRRITFYLAALIAITLTGSWKSVLLYWLLPGFWLLPVIMRIRSLSEHFGLSWKNDLQDSRDYFPNPILRWFLVPHNVNYHLVHHLFPKVPYHHLPNIYRILASDPSFAENAHRNIGLLFGPDSVLADLTDSVPQISKSVGRVTDAA